MTTTVLLALDPQTAPAALLPDAHGVPVVVRLAAGARRHGRVRVLTRPGWEAALSAALSDTDVEVVAVRDAAAGLAWVAQLAAAPAPDGGAVSLVHAHLLADDATLTPVLDGRGGSGLLLHALPDGGPPEERGSAGTGHRAGRAWVREVRGRIVAVSSVAHGVAAPTHEAVGALHLAAGARPALASGAQTLADALRAGVLPDDDDLVAVIAVALVRSGTPLTAVAVPRRGVAALATTPEVVGQVSRRIDGLDVDAVRLDAAVKRDDGFFTTFLVSSYSPRVVRVAARLGLSPDAVTWLSMLVAVGAAAAFAVGSRAGMVAGAVLLQAAFTLDCVDGQLARYQRRFSSRGAWLDAMFDRAKEYLVYAGLALGAVRADDAVGIWLLAGTALALQTFRHTLDLGYASQQAADVDRDVRRPVTDTDTVRPGFWEPAEAPTGTVRRGLRALRAAEAVTVLRWGKRIVVLPIGERFALISVVAVLAGPRAVFAALLVWGGLATAYTFTGRALRSLA